MYQYENGYEFFLNLFCYTIDENNKSIYLNQLKNLETDILTTYESMKEVDFNPEFKPITAEFPSLIKILSILLRVNPSLDDTFTSLFTKNIELLEHLLSEFKSEHETWDNYVYHVPTLNIDVYALEETLGLNRNSFKILKQIVDIGLNRDVLNTLNFLILHLREGFMADVVLGIHDFLTQTNLDKQIRYSSLLHTEEELKNNEHSTLDKQLDAILEETDPDTLEAMLKEFHINIITDKLNHLYDDYQERIKEEL